MCVQMLRRGTSNTAPVIERFHIRLRWDRWQSALLGSTAPADAEESVDAIVIGIDLGQLAFSAAEGLAPEAQLIERLSGYDQALLAFLERPVARAIWARARIASFGSARGAAHANLQNVRRDADAAGTPFARTAG